MKIVYLIGDQEMELKIFKLLDLHIFLTLSGSCNFINECDISIVEINFYVILNALSTEKE